MKSSLFKLMPAAVVLAVAAAAPAAHAEDSTRPTPSVMTDVAPLPASERNSIGAVILEDSMVIAQRQAFVQAGNRTGIGTIGRNAVGTMLRAQTQGELADARANDAARQRSGILDQR